MTKSLDQTKSRSRKNTAIKREKGKKTEKQLIYNEEDEILYTLSAGEAETIAKENSDDADALKGLAVSFLQQSKMSGSPKDFHNLSVNYSRKDDYINACRILERGLELYPNDVDLLADFLRSGINCDMYPKLENVYRRLQNISKMRWTWRGFSFSIDYLLFCAGNICDDNGLTEIKYKALELVKEYERYYPDSEDIFICKYDIYMFFNQIENAEKSLKEAMQKSKVHDRCALRYADIMFDKGEYEKAYEAIKMCLRSAAKSQNTVNLSYVYMLSGLCKISIYYDELREHKDIIRDIYRDFRIARDDLDNPSYDVIMEKQIRILEIKSGVYYDDIIED